MLSIFHHKQFKYLGAFYLHSITRLFAVSLFQIFSSIYVYQTLLSFNFSHTQALACTALFFALIYIIHGLSVAPVLWLIAKRGLRFAVFWGNLSLIGFFFFLFLSKYDPIFLIISAILGGLEIGLYWTGYHIYFVQLTDDQKQGEELSITTSLSALASIGGPAFGGLLINYGGFGAVFLLMGLLLVLAVFPLKYLPKQKDIILVDILKTVKLLAPKKEARTYLSLMGLSIAEMANIIIWPLFVFPILLGFEGLGFVGSLTALFASVMSILGGFLIDKIGSKKIVYFASPIDAIIWVVRSFVFTPLQVFLVSIFSSFTLAAQTIAIDTQIYEKARHTDIVALIVQREVGLALGRVLFLFTLGILFWFGFSLSWVFIITAFCVLLTRGYPFMDNNQLFIKK